MEIFVKERCESTNILADEFARQNPLVSAAFIARSQSGGVGRLGRSFSSEEGGLYMSVTLPGRGESLSSTVGFTAYCAVVAARAIEELCSLPVAIKWVNDLYLGGKKLGGIITKGQLSPGTDRLSSITVGIGINLTNTLPSELKQIATTLCEHTEKCPTPQILGEKIARAIEDGRDGFSSPRLLDEYRNRMLLIGKEITVYSSDREYFATVLGVNPDYSLKIRDCDGIQSDLYTGEVSIRAVDSSNKPIFKK